MNVTASRLSRCEGKVRLEDGDRQRGRNQMKVIEAIVDKLSSPELNYDYAKLFETVQESVEMNFTNEDVKKLTRWRWQSGRRGPWRPPALPERMPMTILIIMGVTCTSCARIWIPWRQRRKRSRK